MGQIQTRNVFSDQNAYYYPDYLRREYISSASDNKGNNGNGGNGGGGNGAGNGGTAKYASVPGIYSSYANPNPSATPVYASAPITAIGSDGQPVQNFTYPGFAPGQQVRGVQGQAIAFNDHAGAPIVGAPARTAEQYGGPGQIRTPIVSSGPLGLVGPSTVKMADGTTYTSPGGTQTSQGFFGNGNLPPSQNPVRPEDTRAAGGRITEPILGVGLHTGRHYSFGEAGDETVTPDDQARGQQYVKDMAQNRRNSQNLATGARGFQQRTFLPDVTERIGGGSPRNTPPPFQFSLGGKTFTTFSDSSGQRHVRDDATGTTMPVGGVQDRGISEGGIVSDSTITDKPSISEGGVVDTGPTLDDLLGNSGGNSGSGGQNPPPPGPTPVPPSPLPPAPLPPAPLPPTPVPPAPLPPVDNGGPDPIVPPPQPPVDTGSTSNNGPITNPPPPSDTGGTNVITSGVDTGSTTPPPPPTGGPQPQPAGTPVTGAGVGDFSVIPNIAAPGTFTGSLPTAQQTRNDILGGADTSAGARGTTTSDPSLFGPSGANSTLSPDELQALLTQ